VVHPREILERWGRWYLFGAQAVTVHGLPPLSADVDVTLALTPDAPERPTWLASGARCGCSMRR
jgi:hypothetical protein